MATGDCIKNAEKYEYQIKLELQLLVKRNSFVFKIVVHISFAVKGCFPKRLGTYALLLTF